MASARRSPPTCWLVVENGMRLGAKASPALLTSALNAQPTFGGSFARPATVQRRSREKVELSNFAVTFDDDAPFSLSIACAVTKFNFRVLVTTIYALLTR